MTKFLSLLCLSLLCIGWQIFENTGKQFYLDLASEALKVTEYFPLDSPE